MTLLSVNIGCLLTMIAFCVFLWRSKRYQTLWIGLTILCGFFYGGLTMGVFGWQPSLNTSLITNIIAQTMLLAFMLWIGRPVSGLFPLFIIYSIMIGGIGLLYGFYIPFIGASNSIGTVGAGVYLHIIGAVYGYALIGLAALTAFSGLLKRYQLKHSQGTIFSSFFSQLPAIHEATQLQQSFLEWACLVLLVTILSGMTLNWVHYDQILMFNHKITLVLFGFMLSLGLYGLDRWFGVGGKRLSLTLLVIFFILTLAYPGVKLIQEVILRG